MTELQMVISIFSLILNCLFPLQGTHIPFVTMTKGFVILVPLEHFLSGIFSYGFSLMYYLKLLSRDVKLPFVYCSFST